MIAKSFEKFDGHNQKHPLTQLEILIKYPWDYIIPPSGMQVSTLYPICWEKPHKSRVVLGAK